jgi:hypothetical protein
MNLLLKTSKSSALYYILELYSFAKSTSFRERLKTKGLVIIKGSSLAFIVKPLSLALVVKPLLA